MPPYKEGLFRRIVNVGWPQVGDEIAVVELFYFISTPFEQHLTLWDAALTSTYEPFNTNLRTLDMPVETPPDVAGSLSLDKFKYPGILVEEEEPLSGFTVIDEAVYHIATDIGVITDFTSSLGAHFVPFTINWVNLTLHDADNILRVTGANLGDFASQVDDYMQVVAIDEGAHTWQLHLHEVLQSHVEGSGTGFTNTYKEIFFLNLSRAKAELGVALPLVLEFLTQGTPANLTIIVGGIAISTWRDKTTFEVDADNRLTSYVGAVGFGAEEFVTNSDVPNGTRTTFLISLSSLGVLSDQEPL